MERLFMMYALGSTQRRLATAGFHQVGTDLYGILGSSSTQEVEFGTAVVLSATSGTRLAVGAPHHDWSSPTSRNASFLNEEGGAVYLYNFNGTDWTLLWFLAGAAGETLGSRVALSADGSRIAVRRQLGGANPSEAVVYDINPSTGSATAVGSPVNCGDSGSTVSLSANGLRMVVSCESYATNVGRMQVFDLNSTTSTWQSAFIVDGEADGDFFGWSTSMSLDGNRVAVSSPNNNASFGLVRVYQYNTNGWTQLGGNLVGTVAGGQFGFALDLSGDGTTLAVGSPQSGNGTVHVYKLQGGTWTQIGNTVTGLGASSRFGRSVSISDDGSRVAASAYFYNQQRGQVRLLQLSGSQWTALGQDIEGAAPLDRFGYGIYSVTMTGDGVRLASGSVWGNDSVGNSVGSVRVFDQVTTLAPSFTPTASPSYTPVAIEFTTPTLSPTVTLITTVPPTSAPTPAPTVKPTPVPTAQPTPAPTVLPTPVPTVPPVTVSPTPVPTVQPTPAPTVKPTLIPTVQPTPAPTAPPTPVPTVLQTPAPTAPPTPAPTTKLSPAPTVPPTPSPTVKPTSAPLAPSTPSTQANELDKFDWDITRVGNATVAFSEEVDTKEIVIHYNISNRVALVQVFQSDCLTDVPDVVAAATGVKTLTSSTYADLAVSLDIKQNTVVGSGIWTDGEVGYGYIGLCVRVDLVLNDTTQESVSFYEQKMFVTIELLGGFEVTGIELDRLAADEETDNTAANYELTACQCDETSQCLESVLNQGSDVFICVTTTAANVQIEDIRSLRFEQGSLSVNSIIDGEEDELTSVSVNGKKATIRSQLISAFFESNNPGDVAAYGVALLKFTNGRRLRANVSLRSLQETKESDNAKFSMSLALRAPSVESTSNASARGAMSMLMVMLGGAVLLI